MAVIGSYFDFIFRGAYKEGYNNEVPVHCRPTDQDADPNVQCACIDMWKLCILNWQNHYNSLTVVFIHDGKR